MEVQIRGDLFGSISIDRKFQHAVEAVQAHGYLFGRQGSVLIGWNCQIVIMGVHARRDLFARQRSISINRNSEPVIVTGQAVSARRLCGARELKKQIFQVGDGGDNVHMSSARTTSDAVSILKRRQQQGLSVDSYTFVEILKGCSKQNDLMAARQVHDCIIQSGMEKNPYVANTLLNAYIRAGRLQDARQVFDGLEMKTVATWRIMIAGYAKTDHAEDALELFNRMRQGSVQPEVLTCLSILKLQVLGHWSG